MIKFKAYLFGFFEVGDEIHPLIMKNMAVIQNNFCKKNIN